MKKRKCTGCGKKAERQTVRGADSEKNGGLPQNDGYYCNSCFDEGLRLEKEAMFGEG